MAITGALRSPEDIELERKLSALEALEAELVDRELELQSLRAELSAFERQYLQIVGTRFAELDELEAEIARIQAARQPANTDLKARSQAATERAQQSKKATLASSPDLPPEFHPSSELKRLYREVARQIHPDLASSSAERERRGRLMAEANEAYKAGDENRLRQILLEWKASPESVEGEGAGAELVRVIRKIAQVEGRLLAIDQERERLERSELGRLLHQVAEARQAERDLLAQMAQRLDSEIMVARQRLQWMLDVGARS
jgi:hypothetical protein